MFSIDKYNCLEYNGREPENIGVAFDISIAKWEFLKENPGVDDGSCHTCGLCMYFLHCGPCPISIEGYNGCNGTPYEEYIQEDTNNRRKIRAIEEIEFLKYLKEKYA